MSLSRTPLAVALVLGVALASHAAAQGRVDLTGVVVDSTDAGLPGATVVLLQPADSALVAFAASGPTGAFRLRRVPAGAYLLRVTFVGYVPHTAALEVEGEPVDVGRIRLAENVDELGQLVVGAERIAMVIRGDTLSYDAAAFRVPSGSTVEDLLKRLPGVEVGRDGTVRAQGQRVARVLVDGKEFFGSDPTVATRNLPAEAVDRVEVFDKESDTAEFTGVADGNEERTINLALNEDHRTGQFGSANGGVGGAGDGDARYDGRASGNRFSPRTQVSLLANANNVNRQAFSFDDYVGFMGGMDALMDGGDSFTVGGDGIPIGDDPSDGFATTWSGGLNLNHEFTSTTKLQSSYLGHRVRAERARRVLQDRVFGEATTSRLEQDADQTDVTRAHRASLRLDHTFGEGHDLRLRSALRVGGTDLSASSQRQTLGLGDVLETTSTSSSALDSRALGGDATLTYRRRFGGGRSVVVEARGALGDEGTDADLAALNRFFQAGDVLTTEEIARLQAQHATTASGGLKGLFTQPLGEDRALQVTVEGRETREDQDRSVRDRVGGALVPNALLSSAFERATQTARGGLVYRDNRDPLNWSVGLDVQRSVLDGTVAGAVAGVDRRFDDVLPSAELTVKIAQTSSANLRYHTSTREPTVRELQPLVDTRDPLNVFVGNPDLGREYTHNLRARYHRFDMFTSTNLFAFVQAMYTPSAISTSRTVDALFRQTSTPVNAGPSWTLNGNASFGTPVRPLRAKVGLLANAFVRSATELLNGEENVSRTSRATLGVKLENKAKERLDLQAGVRVTLNTASASLNPQFDRSYMTRTATAELGWTPTEDWSLRTTLDLTLYPDDVFAARSLSGVGAGRSVPLWEARASRWFMGRRVQLGVVATDLLNRNLGVTYTSTPAFVQEERVDTLGRYVLLRLGYTLGGGAAPGSDIISVRS